MITLLAFIAFLVFLGMMFNSGQRPPPSGAPPQIPSPGQPALGGHQQALAAFMERVFPAAARAFDSNQDPEPLLFQIYVAETGAGKHSFDGIMAEWSSDLKKRDLSQNEMLGMLMVRFFCIKVPSVSLESPRDRAEAWGIVTGVIGRRRAEVVDAAMARFKRASDAMDAHPEWEDEDFSSKLGTPANAVMERVQREYYAAGRSLHYAWMQAGPTKTQLEIMGKFATLMDAMVRQFGADGIRFLSGIDPADHAHVIANLHRIPAEAFEKIHQESRKIRLAHWGTD